MDKILWKSRLFFVIGEGSMLRSDEVMNKIVLQFHVSLNSNEKNDGRDHEVKSSIE